MSEKTDNVALANNEANDLMTEDQKVEQETAGNDEKNQENSLDSNNKTVENMLKEILDEQKDLKKYNIEVAGNLRSVENELQLIRDELKELKPKPVAAADPESSDEEKETNSESENESDIMPTTGKYFVLKHVFKNVSDMKDNEGHYSEAEEHFGVEWRMQMYREKEHLSFFLNCDKSLEAGKWTIETQRKQVLTSNRAESFMKEVSRTYGNDGMRYYSWGWPTFIEWAKMEKDYLVDDQLTAEIHVKIKKTAGIYKDHLRSFDSTTAEFSDVVLIVNDEQFYVSKLYLAAHSPYFKALFLGQFQESKKAEIKLTGIDADDFQNFLEVLYAEQSIDEFTVGGILLVADMYDTPLAIRKCEEFLLKESKKTLKKKLQMSTKYHLDALKKQCLSEIKSVADIKSVLPGDIHDLNPSIMAEFLEKSLSFQ